MILWCGIILVLMIAVVEINRWAIDFGIVTPDNEIRWGQTIGFILGLMFGVIVTALIVIGTL